MFHLHHNPKTAVWMSHRTDKLKKKKCSPAGTLPIMMQQWACNAACNAAGDQEMAVNHFSAAECQNRTALSLNVLLLKQYDTMGDPVPWKIGHCGMKD